MEMTFITVGVALFLGWLFISHRRLRKYEDYCMDQYRLSSFIGRLKYACEKGFVAGEKLRYMADKLSLNHTNAVTEINKTRQQISEKHPKLSCEGGSVKHGFIVLGKFIENDKVSEIPIGKGSISGPLFQMGVSPINASPKK
jgi:hypothetical protein